MKPRVLAFSSIVLVLILCATTWASLTQNIKLALLDLWAHPTAGNNSWFWATLADAYLGFLWFWCWVALREKSWVVRALWLPPLLLAGNIAMAIYAIAAVLRLPAGAGWNEFLLGHRAKRAVNA